MGRIENGQRCGEGEMKKANKTARAEESENKATEVKKTGETKRTGFFWVFFFKKHFRLRGKGRRECEVL